ncbi:hypothetical protein B0H11DRAFT_2107187 [Mycena galericulata]|nr:hypothetical protein B0H11DRAFT_2107187 [Mycena galericulata]
MLKATYVSSLTFRRLSSLSLFDLLSLSLSPLSLSTAPPSLASSPTGSFGTSTSPSRTRPHPALRRRRASLSMNLSLCAPTYSIRPDFLKTMKPKAPLKAQPTNGPRTTRSCSATRGACRLRSNFASRTTSARVPGGRKAGG